MFTTSNSSDEADVVVFNAGGISTSVSVTDVYIEKTCVQGGILTDCSGARCAKNEQKKSDAVHC